MYEQPGLLSSQDTRKASCPEAEKASSALHAGWPTRDVQETITDPFANPYCFSSYSKTAGVAQRVNSLRWIVRHLRLSAI